MEFTGERMVLGTTDVELEWEHLDRYHFAGQLVEGKNVLDAACGTGYGTAILAQRAKRVVGVDISEEAVAYAEGKFGDERIIFHKASVTTLPFPDKEFDVVVSFETLEHIDETAQNCFLREILRVLKPDGILVMSTPNREVYQQRGKNEFHVKELTYIEFKYLLEAKFKNVKFFSQKWEICDAIVGEEADTAIARNGLKSDQSEYLIAVCSHDEIPHIVPQFYVREDDKLKSLMSWAVENHNRNEANNAHIHKLDGIIAQQEQQIQQDAEHIRLLEAKAQESEQAVQKIREDCARQEKVLRKAHMQELSEQQIAFETWKSELLESDRELERIKASRSWRFMSYFWKMRDVLVPKGSKRRLLIKVTIKFLKHPIRFLRKCTPTRIGKFFKTLKREGAQGVSRRLDDCLIGNEIQKQVLQIEAPSNELSGAQVQQKTAADYAPLNVPQWEHPYVSIVIPVYNQFEYTYLCIKSILENSGDISYEILIADDCSTDLTTQIDRIISGLNTIHNEKNLRFLRNCNNAAQYARGKYILFLNNDTQVQQNWLAPLVELIERSDDIGMVGSKLVYPDGRLQEAGGILWKDASAWNFGNRSDPDLPEFNYVKEVDYISGAAIMIRASLWKEIGGFDDNFAPAYCEDSDLAFEVRKHGYKVMYQPLSVVVHFEGVSNGTDTSSGQKAYQITNQNKFFEKWQTVLEDGHYANAENVFLARERGRDKKVLLMVDHYVPHYDKDAGSRTVFQYLQLFVEQGYHVKFIGDNFYPHQPYTQKLQQMGIEVLYGPYYANHWKDWLKENGAQIGYVFLNRPHISVKYIDEIRKYTNARVIYYGHDLHFVRELREYELTGDDQLLKSSEEWKQKELSLMRKADMAYYPSVVEETEIRKIAPDIQVKAIPAYLFSDVQMVEYQAEDRKNLMFIGGFGHRPNVDAVKWLAQEVMPHLEKLIPDIVVHILGSNPPEEVTQLETEHLRMEGFVTDEQLEEYYHTCKMSIVPLRYGAGIKGKVVEAMHYGIPVVTTSVGAEGIVGAEEILAIADDSEQFAKTVAALYTDVQELEQRSKDSVRYIQENYSPENAKQVIGSDFDMN